MCGGTRLISINCKGKSACMESDPSSLRSSQVPPQKNHQLSREQKQLTTWLTFAVMIGPEDSQASKHNDLNLRDSAVTGTMSPFPGGVHTWLSLYDHMYNIDMQTDTGKTRHLPLCPQNARCQNANEQSAECSCRAPGVHPPTRFKGEALLPLRWAQCKGRAGGQETRPHQGLALAP